MSIEQRVKQFYDEAVKINNNTLPITKANKEITTLRKFIHNNQNFNFHEREKAKIFSTIEIYFSICNRKNKVGGDNEKSTLSAQNLIEDSLKVPLFTTKQKKTMLKWYEEEILPPNVDSLKQQEKKNQQKKYYEDSDNEDPYEYDEEEEEEE
ncbi:hypothetical protein DLAC_05936 [Tieghemostelium lacteum]|uniref:Uncharacterized protein n=1 Tax=Tieghemostelium lacteum TaxID=361077 RepID=A0A151ZH82_TIELA|nr:hypothetical protein DLAC_05936 [Tieghemostelium lacteum]|eukprot:KYQ93277.1 hypothetical protein DLAC_05936 [Tieghemostelium lacteum]